MNRKEFPFEYTDEKFSLLLILSCIIIFFILIYTTALNNDLLGGHFVALLLSVGVPLIIFIINKKKIKQQGKGIIHDSFFEVVFEKSRTKINFSEIKSYNIRHYRGSILKIRLINETSIKLVANSNFCDHSYFKSFINELEKSLLLFSDSQHHNLNKEKSIFEQKWFFIFLISMTTIIILGVPLAIISGYKWASIFFLLLFTFIFPLWLGYVLKQKSKNT
ncbi:hypothetical protein [Persicobacter sp. CCB-QB2]|uniref:hypothetical protein n=1 Tax=Persicobacter sp. CCB-QB2 TaxID=1561025 RepID=UPI0006A98887|nr:hypothetical protein [Persicobacter sp. CCB-QB2]